MKNKVKELTPKEFLCAGLGCPSVFEGENGDLYIVGDEVGNEKLPSDVVNKIGKGETVVKVPYELISKLDLKS